MKKSKTILFSAAIIIAVTLLSCNTAGSGSAGQNETWTATQLMEPAELNKILTDAKAEKPVVYSIGFGGGIAGSIEMGAAKDEVNLKKFKEALSKLPKDKPVVIYCGCCPFEHCPNVRPAFQLMNEMGFTNHKLLNLKQNLKVDWIDKGFVTVK